MNQKFNLTGRTFGRLTVLSLAGSRDNQRYWNCLCECGQQKEIYGDNLKRGLVNSCGCLRVENNKARAVHGESFSDEHNAWRNMKSRCNNSNRPDWHLYGGLGITYDPRWESYILFLQDVGRKPTKAHSLGRINNDGNYEPGNVRWETPTEQANNRGSSDLEQKTNLRNLFI